MFRLGILRDVLKTWGVYLSFLAVVVLTLVFRKPINSLLGVEGIEVELIGALILYLLIDIPLKIREFRRTAIDREKAQTVLDTYLVDLRLDTLFVFIDYIYVPVTGEKRVFFPVSDVEVRLDEIDYFEAARAYVALPEKDKIRFGPKTLDDTSTPYNILPGRDLRTGFRRTPYGFMRGMLMNFDKQWVQESSFQELASRLHHITAQIEKLIDLHSSILTVHQLSILTDLVRVIRALTRGELRERKKAMSDGMYGLILLTIMQDLLTKVYPRYIAVCGLSKMPLESVPDALS